MQPTIHHRTQPTATTNRKHLLETQQQQKQQEQQQQEQHQPDNEEIAIVADKSANVIFPPDGFTSFEELVEVSGMLADRPPIAHGESGHSFYTVQPMQLLSWYPRAYLFPKFMDQEKCNHVIALAEPRLAPSGLALKKGESMESNVNVRTSQGTFLSRQDDPDGVLAWIEDKIAVVTGVPAGHGESFNILKYQHGQHYDSHYDAFPEKDYGKQESQRVATVLLYLSDVEDGGETSFILEGKDGMKRLVGVDYKSCNTGIKVKPRAGDALLFWSMNPDHTLDRHSLHGGCAVVRCFVL